MSGLYGSRSKGVALLDSGLTSALPSGELVILPKQGRPSPFARDSVRIRIEPDQELIVVHTLTPVGAPANVDFFATIYWVEVTA